MTRLVTRAVRQALGLLALSLAVGCGASTPPSDVNGPHVAIDVAALNLEGVYDACWEITVTNHGGEVVLTRVISSSQYGDGAGSASYVAPCDADPTAQDNTVTVEVLGLYATSGVDCGAPPASVDFQNPGVLSQDFTCHDNRDVAVRFDVALMRPASQGFFDIAINFGDIFCSAKVDCCRDSDHDGTCERDLELLYNGQGDRDATVVVGFACAAGDETTDTFLYMDPVTIACAGETVASIIPDGEGNLCDAQTDSCVGVTGDLDLLFQVAVYRGAEQLSGVDKAYWNVALGIKTNNFPSGEDCYLTFRGTADDDATDGTTPGTLAGAQGGVIAAGAVYPLVTANVLLSSAASGPWACAENPLNGAGSGVTTSYAPAAGTSLPHCYDPDGGCAAAACTCGARECGVDECGNPCGTCADDAVCSDAGACESCTAFGVDFESKPTDDGWVLSDGDGDGTVAWVAPGGEDGFLRLTEEQAWERAAVYHASETIPAGDASISFDFRITDTGGATGSADGVAFTIVDTDDLAAVVVGTEIGGGIGYHNPNALGVIAASAITVEIDTFYNTPDGGSWTEPAEATSLPHIAVHADLNSRPSGMLDYVDLPGVADGAWHTARVDVVGGTLRIYVDDVLELESTPTNMPSFAGGHMFLSASTGDAYDVHEVDTIRVLGACGGGGSSGGGGLTSFSDDFDDGVIDPAWKPVPFAPTMAPLYDETGGQACTTGDQLSGFLEVDSSQDSYTFAIDMVADGATPTIGLVGITVAGPLYQAALGDMGSGLQGVVAYIDGSPTFLDQRAPSPAFAAGVTHRVTATFVRDVGGSGVGSLSFSVVADPTGANTTIYAYSGPSMDGTLELSSIGFLFGGAGGGVCGDDATLSSTP